MTATCCFLTFVLPTILIAEWQKIAKQWKVLVKPVDFSDGDVTICKMHFIGCKIVT
jgi:hypothetical protein